MRSIGALFFLLAFLYGSASAQKSLAEEMAESEVRLGIYHVTDMMKQNVRMELWKQRLVPFPTTDDQAYEIIKETFGGRVSSVTEISTEWITETRTSSGKSYLREFFMVHPSVLEAGQRSFGYIERRMVSDNSLIESSPMFYGVEKISEKYRATFHIYLTKGEILRIVREYQGDDYFIPMKESHLITRNGAVTQHFIYVRKE